MANYQQPDATFGSYRPATLSLLCPLCAEGNRGLATSIGSGSTQFRCEKGHVFDYPLTSAGPFRPVCDEVGAESRMLLTTLAEFKG